MQSKEKRIYEKYAGIERMVVTDKEDMHVKIMRIIQKTIYSIGCIKPKEESEIREKNIHQKRGEYFREIFHKERDQLIIHRDIERPQILKSDIQSSLAKLNRSKTAILDVILLDMRWLDIISALIIL